MIILCAIIFHRLSLFFPRRRFPFFCADCELIMKRRFPLRFNVPIQDDHHHFVQYYISLFFFLASTLIASPQQWSNIMNIDGVRKTQFWWTAAMMLDEHTKGRQKRETFATTLNGNSALATIELLLHYRQATYINLALLIYARIAYTTRHTCDDEMT